MIDIPATSEKISQFQAWELWFQNVDISNKTLIFDITVQNWGRIGKCMQTLAALTVLLDIIGAPAVRRFGDWLRGITTFAKAKYLMMTGLQLFADIFASGAPEVLFRLDSVTHHTRNLIISVITCCSPSTGREKRLAIILRSYRRTIPIILNSKKGVRRRTRWRARVLPSGVKLQQFQKKHLKFILRTIFGVWAIWTTYLLLYDISREGFAKGILSALTGSMFAFLTLLAVLGILASVINIILPTLLLVTALFAIVADAVLIEPTAWIIGHPKNENLIKGISIIVFLIGFYFDLLAS